MIVYHIFCTQLIEILMGHPLNTAAAAAIVSCIMHDVYTCNCIL